MQNNMRITLNHIHDSSWKKKLTELKNQTDIEEQILLARLAQRERTAFWQLWIRYQQHIYCVCHIRMRSNYENTEYAFNRAMLTAWHQLPDAAGKITHLQSWFSRMTNNICMQICQERQTIARRIENFGLDRERESIEPQYYTWQPSQAAIACSEWERYIYLALDRLSSRQQET